MRRFDLGMSLDYCPQWGIVEAVREFFQNAFDAEVVNPQNNMYFDYNAEEQVLRVGNVNGSLDTNTLLLGMSSKRSDERTIGKHGEGYKVATVVLTRLGKTVKVYNRNKKEVWTAKVIKSRRYKADVVVFDIEKVSIFKSVPNHDLIFEISGITQEEYDDIVESNLHLQTISGVVHEGKSGRILMDEKYAGRLFVGGLFVTNTKYANYGYDFNPDVVKLDRDRGFIDGIDLQFLCGRLICQVGNIDLIKSAKDIWDGEYIRFYTSEYEKHGELADFYESEYNDFLAKNGSDAIPVTDTVTFNRMRRNGFNAVMVTRKDYHYLSSAKGYNEAALEEEDSNSELADKLMNWFTENIDEGMDFYKEGLEIISEVCERLRDA